MLSVKTVLVTGATGFCGHHLCPYLMHKGYRVTGTYFPHPPTSGKPAGYPVVPLDITDPQAVRNLIRKTHPGFLIHLAAQTIPRYSWKHEDETLRINVAGTLHVLDALREYSPGTRMLFISTTQVYGRSFRTGQALDESAPLMPENPYGGSKALAELACMNYVDRYGLNVVIARPFNHLGRGQSPEFVFSDWCRQIAMAEEGLCPPVIEVGNLSLRREFLHVDDVILAYEILIRKGLPGRVYNVCSGRPMALGRCLDLLLKQSFVRFKVFERKNRMRRDDPPVTRGCPRKIQALGWRSRRKLDAALCELLEDWRGRVRNSRSGRRGY